VRPRTRRAAGSLVGSERIGLARHGPHGV